MTGRQRSRAPAAVSARRCEIGVSPGGQWILGEAVAEIGEREGAALGDPPALADPGRVVVEQRRHLGAGLEMPLGVGEEPPPGGVERGAEPDAGEDVEERAAVGGRVPDVVGGDDGYAVRRGEVSEATEQSLAPAFAMTVDVHGEPRAEDAAQPIELDRRVRAGERTVGPAGETEESGGVLLDLRPRDRGLALRPSECAGGEEPAEVAIAAAVLDQ